MSKNFVAASMIAAGLLLWLGSGFFLGDASPREHQPIALQEPSTGLTGEKDPTRVRVEMIRSEQRTRYLVLRGRTESKRAVEVKAEIAGKVVSRPVERGARVAKGDLLCEIALDDRGAAVAEAKAALANATIEYEGSLKLRAQGLQSDIAIAGSAARQEAARAQLHRQELNLERTRITAPFDGVIENLQMNTGDYAVPGGPCATLIDLDPMLVRADVSESDVETLTTGDRVSARTSTGRVLQGVVSFIGKQSDPVTRTYPVEMTVDNSDYSIRSGLTVGVRIGLDEVQAHQITPALFTLDDQGKVGVRVVDKSNRVAWHSVRIIEDGPEGVWVTGLPKATRLITVGQEFVSSGELVDPVYPNDPSTQVAQP
jgi:multidrug efflux system membrane fusion protein